MSLKFLFNPFTGNFDEISEVTLTAVGSTPNADGASVDGDQAITLQPADATHPGVITAADYVTFSGKQPAGNYITALTTDVAASGPGSVAATIQPNVVTNSKLAQMPTLTVKGNNTGGTANSSDLTVAQVNAILPVFTPTLNGLVPLSGGGTTNFLRADGTFAAPPINGTVTSVSVTTANNVTGTVATATTTPAITLAPTSSTPTASSFVSSDANKNISANSFLEGYTTTATAAGTTTLVVGSTEKQYFTGVTTQTVVLPVTSTLTLGQSFTIVNNSTGIVTVQSSGANTIQAMAAGTQLVATVILTSGTTAASWSVSYTIGIVAAVQPTIQKFTSGSGTYTTPAGVQYIKVKMVGAGGGGGSSNNGGGTAGGAGGSTTFGTSLLTAGGGAGGGNTTVPGAGGGSPTINSPAIAVVSLAGVSGQGGNFTSNGATTSLSGGNGGNSFFGGGGGGTDSATGGAGTPNSGSGGAGAGNSGLGTNVYSSSGGGSGAYIEALISSPSATYAYSIGASGTGGTGAGAQGGGLGGSGVVIVEEYYTNLAVGTTTSVAAGTYFGGPYSGSAATPTFKAFQAPTVQKFTSGTGTYTPSTGALYIEVEMVGGGGGGGNSGTSNGTASVSGGATTLGTSLLVANGGTGGAGFSTQKGGAGGTASLGTGPIGLAVTGAQGGGVSYGGTNASSSQFAGGPGGSSALGGAGPGGYNASGGDAASNSGSGGGGGGVSSVSGAYPAVGGGAGGYIRAKVTGATFAAMVATPPSYAVGAGGAGGTSGGSGTTSGAGANGVIVITEYYQ